ncbi:hypothetical protein RCL1_005407 [Eukaryota sp. TZLM3-RCL]
MNNITSLFETIQSAGGLDLFESDFLDEFRTDVTNFYSASTHLVRSNVLSLLFSENSETDKSLIEIISTYRDEKHVKELVSLLESLISIDETFFFQHFCSTNTLSLIKSHLYNSFLQSRLSSTKTCCLSCLGELFHASKVSNLDFSLEFYQNNPSLVSIVTETLRQSMTSVATTVKAEIFKFIGRIFKDFPQKFTKFSEKYSTSLYKHGFPSEVSDKQDSVTLFQGSLQGLTLFLTSFEPFFFLNHKQDYSTSSIFLVLSLGFDSARAVIRRSARGSDVRTRVGLTVTALELITQCASIFKEVLFPVFADFFEDLKQLVLAKSKEIKNSAINCLDAVSLMISNCLIDENFDENSRHELLDFLVSNIENVDTSDREKCHVAFFLIGHVIGPLMTLRRNIQSRELLKKFVHLLVDFKRKLDTSSTSNTTILSTEDTQSVFSVAKSLSRVVPELLPELDLIIDASVTVISLIFESFQRVFYTNRLKLTDSLLSLLFSLSQIDLLYRVLSKCFTNILLKSLPLVNFSENDDSSTSSSIKNKPNFLVFWSRLLNFPCYESVLFPNHSVASISNLSESIADCILIIHRFLIDNILQFALDLSLSITTEVSIEPEESIVDNDKKVFDSELFCRLMYLFYELSRLYPELLPVSATTTATRLIRIVEQSIKSVDSWIVVDSLRAFLVGLSCVDVIPKSIMTPPVSIKNSHYFSIISNKFPNQNGLLDVFLPLFEYFVPIISSLPLKTQASVAILLSNIPILKFSPLIIEFLKVGLSLPLSNSFSSFCCLKALNHWFTNSEHSLWISSISNLSDSLLKIVSFDSKHEESVVRASTFESTFFGVISVDYSDVEQPKPVDLQLIAANLLVKFSRTSNGTKAINFPKIELEISIPHENSQFNFQLSSLLPHVIRLTNHHDEQTRVTAFEALHSITTVICAQIYYRIGTSLDFSDHLSLVLPTILKLGSSTDPVGRNLFRDFSLQLARFFLFIQNVNKVNCPELSSFISIVVNCLGDESNASLRLFSAAVLTFSLSYLMTLSKSNPSIDFSIIFIPLISLSRDPDKSKRLGIVDLFLYEPGVHDIAFHRLFRHSQISSSKYSLGFFSCIIRSLADEQTDQPTNLTDGVRVFTKILIQHLGILIDSSEDRLDFKNLDEFLEFVFDLLALPSFYHRREVLNFLSKILPEYSKAKVIGSTVSDAISKNSKFKQLIIKSITPFKGELSFTNSSFDLDKFLAPLRITRWAAQYKLFPSANFYDQFSAQIVQFCNSDFSNSSEEVLLRLLDVVIELLRFCTVCCPSNPVSDLENFVGKLLTLVDDFGFPSFKLERVFPRLSSSVAIFIHKYSHFQNFVQYFDQIATKISDLLTGFVLSSTLEHFLSIMIEAISRIPPENLLSKFSINNLASSCLDFTLKSVQNSTIPHVTNNICFIYLLLSSPNSVLEKINQLDKLYPTKNIGSQLVFIFKSEFSTFFMQKGLENLQLWRNNFTILTTVLQNYKLYHQHDLTVLRKLSEFCDEILNTHISQPSLAVLEFASSVLSFLDVSRCLIPPSSLIDSIIFICSKSLQECRYSGRTAELSVFIIRQLCKVISDKGINPDIPGLILSPLFDTIPPNPLNLDSDSADYLLSLERFDYVLAIISDLILVSSNCRREAINSLLPCFAWNFDDDLISKKWYSKIETCCNQIISKLVICNSNILLEFFKHVLEIVKNPVYYKAVHKLRELLIIPLIRNQSFLIENVHNLIVSLIDELISLFSQNSESIISQAFKDSNLTRVSSHYLERSTALFLLSLFYNNSDSNWLRDQLPSLINQSDLSKNLLKILLKIRLEPPPAMLQDENLDPNFKSWVSDCLFELRQAGYSAICTVIVKTAKKEKQDILVNAYLLKHTSSEPLWSNYLIDSNKLDYYQTETNFKFSSTSITSSKQPTSSALISESSINSSLSLDPFLGSSETSTDVFTPSFASSTPNLSSELELDFFNSLPIMRPLLDVLDWLPNTSDPNLSRAPFKTIGDLIDKPFPLVVRLFFLKVILNRPNLFKPYLKNYLPSILNTLIEESEQGRVKESPGIHYFLRDWCLFLTLPEFNELLSCLKTSNSVLVSQFVGVLIGRFVMDEAHAPAVLKNNVEIISKFVNIWANYLDINLDACLFLFKRAFTGIPLTHIGKLTLKERSKEPLIFMAISLVDILFQSGYIHTNPKAKCSRWSDLYVFVAKTTGINRQSIQKATGSAIGSVFSACIGISRDEILNTFKSRVNSQLVALYGERHQDYFLRILLSFSEKYPNCIVEYSTQILDVISSNVPPQTRVLFLKLIEISLGTVSIDSISLLISALTPRFSVLIGTKHQETVEFTLKILLKLLGNTTFVVQNYAACIEIFDEIVSMEKSEAISIYAKILLEIYSTTTIDDNDRQICLEKLISIIPLLNNSAEIFSQLRKFTSEEISESLFALIQLISKTNSNSLPVTHIISFINSFISTNYPSVSLYSAIEGTYKDKVISTTPLSITGLTFFSQFFHSMSMSIGGTFEEMESMGSIEELPTVLMLYRKQAEITSQKGQKTEDQMIVPRKRFKKTAFIPHFSSKQEVRMNTLVRKKYRTGEFPDLNISSKDLIEPILYLSFRDSGLSQDFFQSILNCILNDLVTRHLLTDTKFLDLLKFSEKFYSKNLLIPVIEQSRILLKQGLFSNILHENLKEMIDQLISSAVQNNFAPTLINFFEEICLENSSCPPEFIPVYTSNLIYLYDFLNYKHESFAILDLNSFTESKDLDSSIKAREAELSNQFDEAVELYSESIQRIFELPKTFSTDSFELFLKSGLFNSSMLLGDWEGIISLCNEQSIETPGSLAQPPLDRLLLPLLIDSGVFSTVSVVESQNLSIINQISGLIDSEVSNIGGKISTQSDHLFFWNVFKTIFQSNSVYDISISHFNLDLLSFLSSFSSLSSVSRPFDILTDFIDLKGSIDSRQQSNLIESWVHLGSNSSPRNIFREFLSRLLLLSKSNISSEIFRDAVISLGLSALPALENFGFSAAVDKLVEILKSFVHELPILQSLLPIFSTKISNISLNDCRLLFRQSLGDFPNFPITSKFFLNSTKLGLILVDKLANQGESAQSEMQSILIGLLNSSLNVEDRLKTTMIYANLCNQTKNYSELIDSVLTMCSIIPPFSTNVLLQISSWIPLIFGLLIKHPHLEENFSKFLPKISVEFFQPHVHYIVNLLYFQVCFDLVKQIVNQMASFDLNYTILLFNPYSKFILSDNCKLKSFFQKLFLGSSVINFINQIRFLGLPELRFSDAVNEEDQDELKELYKDFITNSSELTGYNAQFQRKWKPLISQFFSQEDKRSGIAQKMKSAPEYKSLLQNPTKNVRDFSKILDEFPYSGIILDPKKGPVASISSSVFYLSSIRRPCKVSFIYANGSSQDYLFKSGEDLRLDQLIQRFFSLFNQSFLIAGLDRFNVEQYNVCPLSSSHGLMGWVLYSVPTDSIARSLPNFGELRQKYSNFYQMTTRDVLVKSSTQVENFAFDLKSQVSKYTFRDYLSTLSSNSFDLSHLIHQFRNDLASISVCGYMVGLGDRHLGNFLLKKSTGQLILIDFGQSFGYSLMTPFPELPPFRMTQNFTGIIDPLVTREFLSRSMTELFSALYKSQHFLLPAYEAFSYSPPADWSHHAGVLMDNGCRDDEDEINSKRVEFFMDRVKGINPITSLLETIAYFQPSPSAFVKGSVKAVEKIKNDCPNRFIEPKDQARLVVELSLDDNIVFRTFSGYSPYV